MGISTQWGSGFENFCFCYEQLTSSQSTKSRVYYVPLIPLAQKSADFKSTLIKQITKKVAAGVLLQKLLCRKKNRGLFHSLADQS